MAQLPFGYEIEEGVGVFVTDPHGRPIGYVPIRALLSHSIHDRVDLMRLARGQFGNVLEVIDVAIHPRADEAGLADLRQNVLVSPAATSNQWRQNHGLGACRQVHDPILDLLRSLLLYLVTALVAVCIIYVFKVVDVTHRQR